MKRACALLTVLAVAAAGCGGSSKVSASAYVKSMCTALEGWKSQVQAAGGALQSSGVATASPTAAKAQYVRFVSALVAATRRSTTSLKAAGAPDVTGGETIASGLSGAFERGTQGLASALSRARAIPTTSTQGFESAATAVTGEIRSALQNIAGITPRSNPQLRAAAGKNAACRALAG